MWTLQKVDQKYLARFEMWCWRRMEKLSYTDHVRSVTESRGGAEYPADNKRKEG
jgi:hypothetical protein